ncbi:transglutaminase domain-containing protein [Pseudooceanicola sp. MF1-13]|uniref:transglutaminase family protein n=1 Tax=Pseudooceanicola sp. MF1-13 TaxID=3379095 RepID=UPI0038924587
MNLTIQHTTTYRFEDPVTFGLQQVRMTPLTNDVQAVSDWVIDIEGGKIETGFLDHHRNQVDLISLNRGVTELILTSHGKVATCDTNGVLGPHLGPVPLWLFRKQTDRTKPGPNTRRLARQAEGDTQLAQMHDLMAQVAEAVEYKTGTSQSDWTAEDAVTEGQGVCQDHAHVFISCARELGLPARYVSGYLMMDDRTDQEAMHAWAEAFIDGLGWVGFDVSNAQCPDERYVRVATGLDYSEAAPVIGTRVGGAEESLSVQIQVAQQQ